MTNTDSHRACRPSETQPGTSGLPFPLAESAVAMEIDPDRTVPIALSDNPAALLDPDRTLPMEPELLEQLCAQTRVSERRRALPRELEYSLNVLVASEAAALPEVPDLAGRLAARYAAGRQLLALLLGPCLGMIVGVGVGVAWQLGLYAPWHSSSRADQVMRVDAETAARMTWSVEPLPFPYSAPDEEDLRSIAATAVPAGAPARPAELPAPSLAAAAVGAAASAGTATP